MDARSIRRIKVTFGSGYATDLELRVWKDGISWMTVAQTRGLNGNPYNVDSAPVPARYVRVCGPKPDGPEQTGKQMSIAEFEMYH